MVVTSATVKSKTGAVLRLVRGLQVSERRANAGKTAPRVREQVNKEEICALFGLNGPVKTTDDTDTFKTSEVKEQTTLASMRSALYAK